ncbi:MAG: UDP-N-acetylmuramate dehydrogenase [Campylobacteraceae bacterium]|jgi:UDP-N-acetylmuramate dehydrogenase|nr:UDP-N-acetylmuramate dehydrogenase [Campylobacteraceae bacterium]
MKEIDFSKFSSIKIGPKVKVAEIDEICEIPKEFFLIGGANNLLVAPNPPPLALLSKRFDYIFEDEKGVHAGAAVKSGKLLSYAKKHDLKGFELLQKLPGTIGGIVKMNAGLKEFCISDNIISVLTNNGWKRKEEIDFGYRTSSIKGVIFETLFAKKEGFDTALFEIFKNLRSNQPNIPSAGSCFKNPSGDFAGRLLEQAGLKGMRIGNMAFSDIHANFLVNLGGGTYEEAITLITAAHKAVFEKFGIKLELEIKIVSKTRSADLF